MLWDGKNYAYNARPAVNAEKYIGGTKLATDISILETNFNPSLIVTKIWEIRVATNFPRSSTGTGAIRI